MKRPFAIFVILLGFVINFTITVDGVIPKGRCSEPNEALHNPACKRYRSMPVKQFTAAPKIILPKTTPKIVLLKTTMKIVLPETTPVRSTTPNNTVKHKKIIWIDIDPLVNPDTIKNLANNHLINTNVSLANTTNGQDLPNVRDGNLPFKNFSTQPTTNFTTNFTGNPNSSINSIPIVVTSQPKFNPLGNSTQPINSSSTRPSARTTQNQLTQILGNKTLDNKTGNVTVMGRSFSKKRNASRSFKKRNKSSTLQGAKVKVVSADALFNATAKRVWSNFLNQNKNNSRPDENPKAMANSKVKQGNATSTAISRTGGLVVAKAQSSKGNSAAAAASVGSSLLEGSNRKAVASAISKGGRSKAVAIGSNVGVVKETKPRSLNPDADELREEVDEALKNK